MKKFYFLLFTSILFLFITKQVFSEEKNIFPKKKPVLVPQIKEKKISKNILLPLKKPVKKDKTESKEDEIVKETKTTTKLGIIVPKNKPKIVSKKIKTAEVKSKYFSKKKFRLAKKSIEAFEKGRWTEALSLAKKSKDKSIYNFVQWRHLLTRGNKASYYDYQQFILNNPDYPRI